LLERLTPEQRQHFSAQMVLMRQHFDARMRRAGDWPERGCPFDEYDGEGRLHGLDRQEHREMRRWAGRARA
jgi:hypothetical protein